MSHPFGRCLLLTALITLLFASACQREVTPPVEVRAPEPERVTPAEPPVPPPVDWRDYEEAVRLYVNGKHEEVYYLLVRIAGLKTLTDSQRRRLNFLSGLNAVKWGRPEKALEYLNPPRPLPEALTAYAAYYRGLALKEAGRFAEARAAFAQFLDLSPGGELADKAPLLIAESHYLEGDYDQALGKAKALLDSAVSANARLLTARVYEAQGRINQARDAYRMAMEKSKIREVRAEAAHKYRTLLLPVADQPGQEELKLTLVRFLRKEWRLDETALVADKIMAQGGGANFLDSIAQERAKAWYYSGDLDRALAWFESTAPKNGYSAYMYAHALKRLGRWEQAVEALLVAAKRYPRKATLCRFDAGKAYLKLGDLKAAERVWRAVGGGYRDEKLWYKAFFFMENKQYDQAAGEFSTLLKRYPKSKFADGAKYWRARCHEHLGQGPQAVDVYQKLAASKDDYYYRLLAENRLGLPAKETGWRDWSDQAFFRDLLGENREGGLSAWAYSDPGLGFDSLLLERRQAADMTLPANASADARAALTRFKEAAAAGALDAAFMEAERLTGLTRRSASADLRLQLLAFRSAFLAESRQYDDFVRLQYDYYRTIVSPHSGEQRLIAKRRYYPLAYPDGVLAASREYNLHPAAILSVMRTESYYQPDILSYANARGLMQILPPTGDKIARRMGAAALDYDDLFRPEINIRFGAWYLGALVDEFSGQLPLAFASYNGGPFNVKRWVDQAGDVTLAEFIETIPFDQTRLYVKKILGTMYRYRLLFFGRPALPDLETPLIKAHGDKINF